jgi:hypothetical protein
VLIGGPGQDVLDGGTGSNILIQSATVKPPVNGPLAANAKGGVNGSIDLTGANSSIDLTGISFGGNTTLGYSANSDNTGGTLTVSDGSHAASVALLGQYMASSFVMASDGHGGTLITDPQSNQAPLLTQPHA